MCLDDKLCASSLPIAPLEVADQYYWVLLHVENHRQICTAGNDVGHTHRREQTLQKVDFINSFLVSSVPSSVSAPETIKSSRGWEQVEAGLHPKLVSGLMLKTLCVGKENQRLIESIRHCLCYTFVLRSKKKLAEWFHLFSAVLQ